MAEINRGEIWQFSFPHPNKRRPVLVLTRQEVIDHLHTVTVAPLTTTIVGTVTPPVFRAVREALLFALGFDGAKDLG